NVIQCVLREMPAARRKWISNHRAARTGVCLAIMFAGFPDFAQNPPSTPWRAKASVNVIIEERSFTSRGVHLSGTLYIPRANKPVPAIVVLHSASSPTRDMPLYQHLVEMLPPLGIGVRSEERRVGKGGRSRWCP